MKLKFLAVGLISAATSISQIADFEDLVIPAEDALYGQDQVTDGDTIYTSGVFNFETNYNAAWMSFAGWAFSNVTDNTTPGWANQYSAITGEGNGGSDNYALCYISGFNSQRIFHTGASANMFSGLYITNTTYAYHSMLDGDSFAKKFGEDTSATGLIDGTNGEDWFLLTIYGLDADSMYTGDSVNFYLADYRFAEDSLDYIIDEWTWLDLTPLGVAKGMDFKLTSSDTTGGFGMNTPAYFAIDDLSLVFFGLDEEASSEVEVYPNPVADQLTINGVEGMNVHMYSISGTLQFEGVMDNSETTLDVSGFDQGIYLLMTEYEGVITEHKIIKR